MSTPAPNSPSGKGLGPVGWTAAALLAIACCAGPGLIATGVAAGVLGAVGAWLSNPWIIGLAVVVAGVTAVLVGKLVRRRAGTCDKQG